MYRQRYFAQRYHLALYFSKSDILLTTPYGAVFDPLLGKLVLHVHKDVNANALDGRDSTYFLPASSFNGDNVLTLIKTVDGTGSGLDSDLLDGQHASAFAPVSVISSKTADYPLVAADAIINFTANNCTATLPTAVGVGGKIYNIKNSGTGVVTIATTSSQTIDGAASGSITLDQYDNLTVASDGANWIIL